MGLNLTDAERVLHDLDLRAEVSKTPDPSVPPDAVLASDPAAGTGTTKGSSVRLTVSLGPKVAAVPDLKGLTSSDAAARLAEAGLALGTVNGTGVVVNQDPAAGTSVPQGAQVTVVLSKGTPSPKVTPQPKPPPTTTTTTTKPSVTVTTKTTETRLPPP